jgi:hypothetical protein
MRFQILDYLLTLWPKFPEEAALYLEIFERNPFLLSDDYNTHKVMDFLKISLIKEAGKVTNGTKVKLISILENW